MIALTTTHTIGPRVDGLASGDNSSDEVLVAVGDLDQHAAVMFAVAGLHKRPHAFDVPAEELSTLPWSTGASLAWLLASWMGESPTSDPSTPDLAQWRQTWTPGRREAWAGLFGESSAEPHGVSRYASDCGAFINPHRVADPAVDHHPLSDLVGRWVSAHLDERNGDGSAQLREDVRRVATELVRNIAEHGARAEARPDTSIVMVTFTYDKFVMTVADCGRGIPTTARDKLLDAEPRAGLSDGELVAKLFDRRVQLQTFARNRGLPQLLNVCRRQRASCVVTAGHASVVVQAEEAPRVERLDVPTHGTVATFTLPLA